MIIDYKTLIDKIENNKRILFVSCLKHYIPNSYSEKLYYDLYSLYNDRISIYGSYLLNKNTKLYIRGQPKNSSQLLFINIKNLQKNKSISAFREIIYLDTNESYKTFKDESWFSKVDLKNNYDILRSPENKLFLKGRNPNGNIMIIDTETNGIPLSDINRKCAKYSTPNAYTNARLLSIGWALFDSNLNLIHDNYYLIKNNKIHNSIQAERINHISDEEREKEGKLLAEVYEVFKEDLLTCNYIVSHGTDFDINVLAFEFSNIDLKLDIFDNVVILNTKQNLYKENYKQGLSNIVKLNDKKFMDYGPHHALYDVYLCYELLKIRIGIKN